MTAVSRRNFGTLPDGRLVEAITLTGDAGFSATLLTLGATLQALEAPAPDGSLADVVLGFSSVEAVLADGCYLGATVGRYANRIAQATFGLDGTTYTLPRNNGDHCLHGGSVGFNRALWKVETLGEGPGGAAELVLSHLSPDGDQGFPGEVRIEARFTVRGCRLEVDYVATTTAPTPISLTFHPYFNLDGEGLILDHAVRLKARAYLPTDETAIPLKPAPVAGTPFDFLTFHRLGEHIDADDAQIRCGQGYDHCFLVDDGETAAEVFSRKSGRRLRLSTNQKGLQLYSGAYLGDGPVGKKGFVPPRRSGLCLEPQALPDSPNRPDFPSAILRPGEIYHNRLVFDFDPAP